MSKAGLLERFLGGSLRAANPFDDRLYEGAGVGSARTGPVTADSALSFDACFAAVSIIAEDVATLPLDVNKRRPAGGRDHLPDHPVARIFNVQANEYQTGLEFREWMTRIAFFYPESVAEIHPGARGMVEMLSPLMPAWLTKETLPNGTMRYEVKEPGKIRRYLGLDQVFRLPSRLGVGLIQLMRDDIGAALDANRTTAAMMKHGLTPRMALEHKEELSPAAQERLSADVGAKVLGPDNAGHIPVFEEGMKWIQIGIKPADAQLIDQLQFSVLKMARWSRVKPHKLAWLTEGTSYASVEQSNIEHVTDTVRPWAIRWEKAGDAQLLPLEVGTYLKHNVDALLRGDTLSRNQALEIRRRNGVINANEWRDLDDLNPRDDPEGDDYWSKQPGTGDGQNNDPGSKQSPKARALAYAAASRLVAKELSAVKRNGAKFASDWDGWSAWMAEFFAEHAGDVARTLFISERSARLYAEAKRAELAEDGLKVIEKWEARDLPMLAELALEGDD